MRHVPHRLVRASRLVLPGHDGRGGTFVAQDSRQLDMENWDGAKRSGGYERGVISGKINFQCDRVVNITENV